MKRIENFVLRLIYPDVTQREAMMHLYPGLTKIAERRARFRSAPYDVRVHVIAALRARSASQQGSHVASAISVAGAMSLGAATLVGSLVVALFTGYYNWMLKMTDTKTGDVAGMTDADVSRILDAPIKLVLAIAFLLPCAAFVVYLFARWRDLARGNWAAWLAIFEEDHLARSVRRGSVFRTSTRLAGR